MKNRTVIVGVALLAAASALAAGQAVALKRVVKVGETANYGMKIDLNFQGTAVNVTFDVSHKISKVNEDGSYVIHEEVKNEKVLVGGSEMPNEGGTETSMTTYSATGQVIKVESQGMGGEHRLSNLTAIIWPTKGVEVGSKWTAKTGANKDSGALENDYSFEVAARETLLGYDTFKIVSVVKEVGGNAVCNANSWVDIKTGLLVKATGHMKSVEIQGMEMDADFVLEMKK
jgi:hypothetical protein